MYDCLLCGRNTRTHHTESKQKYHDVNFVISDAKIGIWQLDFSDDKVGIMVTPVSRITPVAPYLSRAPGDHRSSDKSSWLEWSQGYQKMSLCLRWGHWSTSQGTHQMLYHWPGATRMPRQSSPWGTLRMRARTLVTTSTWPGEEIEYVCFTNIEFQTVVSPIAVSQNVVYMCFPNQEQNGKWLLMMHENNVLQKWFRDRSAMANWCMVHQNQIYYPDQRWP